MKIQADRLSMMRAYSYPYILIMCVTCIMRDFVVNSDMHAGSLTREREERDRRGEANTCIQETEAKHLRL